MSVLIDGPTGRAKEAKPMSRSGDVALLRAVSALFISGSALEDSTADEILRALRESPAEMTRDELRNYSTATCPRHG